MHTTRILECKQDSLFFLSGCTAVMKNKWQGGGVCANHRCAIRANKIEAEANWRSKYEAPPSLADMHELKTPTCLVQIRQKKRIIMCFKNTVWIEVEDW